MTDELQALLDKTRKLLADGKMLPSQMAGSRAQRISWAYGQVAIENPNVTEAMVEEVVDEMDRKEREELRQQLFDASAKYQQYMDDVTKQRDNLRKEVAALHDWFDDIQSEAQRVVAGEGASHIVSYVIDACTKATATNEPARPRGMSPNEYQLEALRTEKTPLFINPAYIEERRADGILDGIDARAFSRLLHGLLGMCTETGEAQDMAKKGLIYKRPIDKTNILEESGDKLWYIALALDAVGYTMREAMEKNIAKLRTRYPEKFSEERAVNRDVDAERKVLEARRTWSHIRYRDDDSTGPGPDSPHTPDGVFGDGGESK